MLGLMREAASLLCALALLIGGLYVLYQQFFGTAEFMDELVFAGAFVSFLGAAWIWSDFR